jgi:hypothetical protein
MLTSYFVKCPHLGCDWLGSLLPRREGVSFPGARPSSSLVAFVCPSCRGEWHCRVVGDDVVPVNVEAAVAGASA